MQKLIRRAIRSLGWDLHRFRPAQCPEYQLLSALSYADVNVVFDVGANVGQFSSGLRSLGFSGKIVSFEPLSSAHEELAAAAKSDEYWLIHPRCAVGDRNGEIEIHISGNSVSSSVLPMLDAHSSAASDSAYVASESTPLITLDSVAAKYLDEDSRVFLKIDTQGFEWQVLDGAESTLKRAKGVLCEVSLVPLYEGQRLWRDVIARLEAEGFVLWTLQPVFADARNGRSLQMDAIFLRNDLRE